MPTRLSLRAAAALAAVAGTGCYHFTFDHAATPTERAAPAVRYALHVPTYLNGFVGNGRIDTRDFCDHPIRTELRVTAMDVLVSVATFLLYTPHTLYVTCPVREMRILDAAP